jgi:hypothetical protein
MRDTSMDCASGGFLSWPKRIATIGLPKYR